MNVSEAIEQIADSDLDYEETHTDAGDGYSHQPREGGWDYYNNDDRLLDFIVDNEIDTHGLEPEVLADLVLDNFEMVSRHSLALTNSLVFSVDSYAVGEVESQIEYSTLTELTGIEVNKENIVELSDGFVLAHRAYMDNCLVYSPSDMEWNAEIHASYLQELIDDYTDTYDQ